MGTTSIGDSTHRVTAESVARTIRFDDGVPRTIEVAPASGHALSIHGHELSVVLDSATWRHDIPTWRWIEAPDEAMPENWAQPDFDDHDWRYVPHLHPVLTARAQAPSWFRASVQLPAEMRGSTVTLVLGGLDGQDWSHYRVFLGGLPVDAWSATGSLREPRRIIINAADPRYETLGFGESTVLAIRCEDLEREHEAMVEGEREHHYFADWLLDQYIAVGQPTRSLNDFVAEDIRNAPDESWLEYDLRSADEPALVATVRHAAEGSHLRKTVWLRNEGTHKLQVLDVVGEDWRGDLGASQGGRGQPIFSGDLFAGIEHPAGVSQGDATRLRLIEMPGCVIPSGGTWQARSIVIGGRGTSGLDKAFRSYIAGLRERPATAVRVYSALGWYDFTNPADALPELTADLVEENLKQLGELAEEGATFDIYMLDDWWDWRDLRCLRPGAFPGGTLPLREAIEASGMHAGIWWATTRALWSVKDLPGGEAAWANDPRIGEAVALAGGEWRWLEEFTNMIVGERRFCLAAEPYRSHYQEALPALIVDLDARLIKLDCSVLHCTSSAHEHRPGRYSMQPMVDALVDLLQRCEATSPDLRVVLYWGFRSPWFLAFGDALFDKGLLMEAATVSSAPAPTVRQSLSTNVDQAIRHARSLPLNLQDSLGTWVGDVAWCNRIGIEEWHEALLVDIARGADLLQLWGDLTMFGAHDRANLGAVFSWLDRHHMPAAEAVEFGGDPWLGEPYGYARAGRDGPIVTFVNPGWQHARITLPSSLPAWPNAAVAMLELYPFPGPFKGTEHDEHSVLLAPFEVRVIEIVDATRVPGLAAVRTAPTVRPTRELDCPIDPRGGLVHLPEIHRGDVIYVEQRLKRDGQWAYQPEPQAMLGFEVSLDGMAVRSSTIPTSRGRNGPGSPWVLRRIPAGPAWSGRDLRFDLDDTTSDDLEVKTRALLVDAWWLRHRRRFEDVLGRHEAGSASHPTR